MRTSPDTPVPAARRATGARALGAAPLADSPSPTLPPPALLAVVAPPAPPPQTPPEVDAAHELRGATARISMYAAALAERADGMPPAELAAALARLAREADALGSVCLAILDRHRTGPTGRVGPRREVPVAEVIQLVLDGEREPDRQVEVRLDDDLTVATDPFALNRILSNLLRNAYQHGGRHLVIEAHLTEGALVLSVGDDGPGVPEHLVPLLFEPHGSTRDDGHGLGLDMVCRLAQSLDGRVGYQPNDPRGAKFVVTLPST